MLIAVPSNDFGGQEPLDGAAIATAVRASYGATYAFAEKTRVRGPDAHPFYRWAASRRPTETPRWNFHKYLVGRTGELVAGFSTQSDPCRPAAGAGDRAAAHGLIFAAPFLRTILVARHASRAARGRRNSRWRAAVSCAMLQPRPSRPDVAERLAEVP